jgi:hypothetical protein
MNFNKYQLDEPKKPVKPVLDSTSKDPAHFTAYANKLSTYNHEVVKYDRTKEWYKLRKKELFEAFKEDALRETGLIKHPNKDKIFNYAFNEGRTEGLATIYDYLEDLADIIL